MRFVLDADVVIGALDAVDAHHADARARLTEWRERDDAVLISVVNLAEVLVAPAVDRGRLRRARAAIAALGISAVAPTEPVGVEASRLRGRHPISLPDAFLLATVRQTGGTLVSFDRRVLAAADLEGLPAMPLPRPPA